MASETLSVGSPPITVPNQGFGLVFHASTDFLGVSCDGLFVRPGSAPARTALVLAHRSSALYLFPHPQVDKQLQCKKQFASDVSVCYLAMPQTSAREGPRRCQV